VGLPVVVIGAGPQGLAAAAHLLERDLEPLVLEQGTRPAAAVAGWGHVRLFSEWPELIDQAAARLLAPSGWRANEHGYPTGEAWISDYLAPLAHALGERVRFGTRVTGIGRKGRDLLVDAGRAEQPFVVHVEEPGGAQSRIEARAVIDASGSWSAPNLAGADGLPTIGEAEATGFLTYRIPAFENPAEYAGRHTVVLGSGHSAITAVTELARIARQYPETRITWALRRDGVGSTFGGGDADQLPARGALGERAKDAVDHGIVSLVTGFRTERIDTTDQGAVLTAEDGRALDPAARVVVLTGFRPDLSFLSEIRLELDARLQAPVRIAADIDPNIHSCGSVRTTGAADLAQPEPDFFIVGAKSYGRAPTFLALTGYEQVRSVVAQLSGDHEAAARVELVLPETGVCGGAGLFDDPDAAKGEACCAPAPKVLQIGRAPVSATR